MGSISLSKKLLDKYFAFLARFDNHTKKQLIIKLTNSIETEPPPKNSLRSLFGAWEDTRSAEEIIQEIRAARVESKDGPSF